MKIFALNIQNNYTSPAFGTLNHNKNTIGAFLKEQKINDKRRFTDEEIKNISNQIELNRKKYNTPKNKNDSFLDALKEMIKYRKPRYIDKNQSYLSLEDIISLLSTKSCIKEGYVFNHLFLDYFGMREGLSGKDIIKIRDAAEGHEFCGYAIQAMLTANDNKGNLVYSIDDICEILKHADIKTGMYGLYDIIKTQIYDEKLCGKRYMSKDELIKILSENGKEFKIRTSPSGLRIFQQGIIKNYELTSNGLEQISKEKQIIDHNKKTAKVRRIYTDGRQTFCVSNFGNHVFQNSYSAIYDNEGNRLYYEQLRPSKEHPDLFLLDRLSNNQKQKNAYIENIPNGYIYRINFESPEGITTNQTIIHNGNEQNSVYTMKDSNGKILLSQKRKFETLDDNHTQSQLNSQKYDMRFFDKKIEVTKQGENPIILDRRLLNMKLLNMYKKLPGDVLYLIHSLGIKIQPAKTIEDCQYNEIDKIIQTLSDTGIFMHEFGHAIDHLLLNSNFRNKLAKIYRKEFSEVSRNTNELTVGSLYKFDKLCEFIAEGYQILSGEHTTAKYIKDLGIRTINLQRYLPNSMSNLAKQYLKLGII